MRASNGLPQRRSDKMQRIDAHPRHTSGWDEPQAKFTPVVGQDVHPSGNPSVPTPQFKAASRDEAAETQKADTGTTRTPGSPGHSNLSQGPDDVRSGNVEEEENDADGWQEEHVPEGKSKNGGRRNQRRTRSRAKKNDSHQEQAQPSPELPARRWYLSLEEARKELLDFMLAPITPFSGRLDRQLPTLDQVLAEASATEKVCSKEEFRRARDLVNFFPHQSRDLLTWYELVKLKWDDLSDSDIERVLKLQLDHEGSDIWRSLTARGRYPGDLALLLEYYDFRRAWKDGKKSYEQYLTSLDQDFIEQKIPLAEYWTRLIGGGVRRFLVAPFSCCAGHGGTESLRHRAGGKKHAVSAQLQASY